MIPNLKAKGATLRAIRGEGDSLPQENVAENSKMGYIKLFRSIRNHWLWDEPQMLQWWLDIILEVNHTPRKVLIKGELYTCGRGQSLRSVQEWAMRWRVNESKVRRFFKLLEQDEMIVTEGLKYTTRLTVCKYDSYNDLRRTDDELPADWRSSRDELPTTNKNEKNEKNEEEYITTAQPAVSGERVSGGSDSGKEEPQHEWTYSRFYDTEIANNEGAPMIDGYKGMVNFLFGLATKKPLKRVLKLEHQIGYEDYVYLKEVEKTAARSLRDVLEDMENWKELTKKNTDAYRTALNWLRRPPKQ